jgi:hypothetical protein
VAWEEGWEEMIIREQKTPHSFVIFGHEILISLALRKYAALSQTPGTRHISYSLKEFFTFLDILTHEEFSA